MAQTTFKANFNSLLNGLVTPYSVTEKITLMCNDTTLAFGVAVKRDDAGTCVIADASSTPVGISVLRHNEDGEYKETEEVAVLTKGAIAVVTEGTGIVAGDKAYWNPATALFTKVDTATIEIGVFQDSVQNDNLAVVKLDVLA